MNKLISTLVIVVLLGGSHYTTYQSAKDKIQRAAIEQGLGYFDKFLDFKLKTREEVVEEFLKEQMIKQMQEQMNQLREQKNSPQEQKQALPPTAQY